MKERLEQNSKTQEAGPGLIPTVGTNTEFSILTCVYCVYLSTPPASHHPGLLLKRIKDLDEAYFSTLKTKPAQYGVGSHKVRVFIGFQQKLVLSF